MHGSVYYINTNDSVKYLTGKVAKLEKPLSFSFLVVFFDFRFEILFETLLFFMITIKNKIFDANFTFQVKKRTAGKVQFLFFRNFWLVLEKFSF